MSILQKGILIAIEGIDGSGKSTLAASLAHSLANENLSTLLTKEPGGTSLGNQLRAILQNQSVPLDPKAEFLLFAADRAQHFKEIVIPNLHAKKIIISDRMADSSLVYQGYGRGLDIAMIKTVNAWAMGNIEPDLVIYLKIDSEHALQRLQQRKEGLSTFEQDRINFTQKLIAGYAAIFKERSNVISLDGSLPLDKNVNQATKEILTWIDTHKLRA